MSTLTRFKINVFAYCFPQSRSTFIMSKDKTEISPACANLLTQLKVLLYFRILSCRRQDGTHVAFFAVAASLASRLLLLLFLHKQSSEHFAKPSRLVDYFVTGITHGLLLALGLRKYAASFCKARQNFWFCLVSGELFGLEMELE